MDLTRQDPGAVYPNMDHCDELLVSYSSSLTSSVTEGCSCIFRQPY